MSKSLLASLALAVVLVSGAAMAQTPTVAPVVPDHPRVNEVNERIENQQKRIDAGVAKGEINAKQEVRDESKLTKVENQLSADEAKHNGHITKHEEKKLNKELKHNSKRIHHQREEGAEKLNETK